MTKFKDRYKKIGRLISHYRKLRGFTQEQLAEKIGVSKSYISKIEAENCNKSFSLEILFEIADALEIDIKDLM